MNQKSIFIFLANAGYFFLHDDQKDNIWAHDVQTACIVSFLSMHYTCPQKDMQIPELQTQQQKEKEKKVHVLPLDISVSLEPTAMNTGLRSEIGLAVIIFPPIAWQYMRDIQHHPHTDTHKQTSVSLTHVGDTILNSHISKHFKKNRSCVCSHFWKGY